MTHPALPPLTEAAFQRQVIALAKLRGWKAFADDENPEKQGDFQRFGLSNDCGNR